MEKEKKHGDTIKYVSLENFRKNDLRVAKIKGVKDHPNADKLYILDISLGKGEHDLQLVAGLKNHYKKEDLIGKSIPNLIVNRNFDSDWTASTCFA